MSIPVTYYDHPILRARELSLSDDRCQEMQAIGYNKVSKMPLIYKEETLLSPMVWNSTHAKFIADYAKSLRKTNDAKTPKKVTTFVEMYFEIFKQDEDVEMKPIDKKPGDESAKINEEILDMLKTVTSHVEQTIEYQLQQEAIRNQIEQMLKNVEFAGKLDEVEKLNDVLFSLATKNTQKNVLKTFTDLSEEKLNEIGDQSTPDLVSLLGDKVESVKNSLDIVIKIPAIERHPVIQAPVKQGLDELYAQLGKPNVVDIILGEL
jgi:hypothetical protein